MMIFKGFLSSLLSKPQAENSKIAMNISRDSYSENGTVNVVNNTYHNCNLTANIPTLESIDFESNIQCELNKIDSYIEIGKYEEAMHDCTAILINPSARLNYNDKIEISIFMLNCSIHKTNMSDADTLIERLLNDKHLLDSPNAWKFYFYASVHNYNKQNITEAKRFIDYALKLSPLNPKIIIFNKLCNIEEINITELISDYLDETSCVKDDSLKDKDKKYIQYILGQMALLKMHYNDSIRIFEAVKSPKYTDVYNLAVAYHLHSTSKSDTISVNMSRIHIPSLKMAISKYELLLTSFYTELSDELRNSVVNNYLTCLYLINDIDKFKQQYLSYYHKGIINNEVEKIYGYILYSETGDHSFVAGNLSNSDKQWLIILELHQQQKFQSIVDILSSENLKNDLFEDKFYAIKLDAILQLEDYDLFSAEITCALQKHPNSTLIQIFNSKYIRESQGIEQAITYLESLSLFSDDSRIQIEYFEMIRFLEDEEKTYNVLVKILSNSYIPESFKLEAFRRFINDLLKSMNYKLALRLADENTLDESMELNEISSDIYYYARDYVKAELLLQKLNQIRTNKDTLYRHLICNIKLNNLDKALKICNDLTLIDRTSKSHYLTIQSQIYLYLNDYEMSFKSIKEAVELDKDLPKADSHRIFTHMVLRLGKTEEFSYIPEYMKMYPTHNEWLRPVTVLRKNAKGEDELTEEMLDILNKQKNGFETNLYNYKNRQFNYSSFCNIFNKTYIEMLPWRHYYGIKIWINQDSGNETKEFSELCKGIVLDSGTLYILKELGLLEIALSNFKITVSQSIIEEYQELLLSEENLKVRELLDLIKHNPSITLISNMSYNINSLNLPIGINKMFKQDQLDAMGSLMESNGILIYSDVFQKGIAEHMKTNKYISIITFIEILRSNEMISFDKYLDSIVYLKTNNYEFIPFDANILFEIYKRNDFKFTQELSMFFKLSKDYDILNFSNMLSQFLIRVWKELSKEYFDEVLTKVIEVAESYYKKRQFYILALSIKFPKYKMLFMNILKNTDSKSISILLTYSILSRDYYNIVSTNEYKRFQEIYLFNKSLLISVLKIISFDSDLEKYANLIIQNSSMKHNELHQYIELLRNEK